MDAKCIKCNKYWNISVKQHIKQEGYVCPVCRYKERKIDEHNKRTNMDK